MAALPSISGTLALPLPPDCRYPGIPPSVSVTSVSVTGGNKHGERGLRCIRGGGVWVMVLSNAAGHGGPGGSGNGEERNLWEEAHPAPRRLRFGDTPVNFVRGLPFPSAPTQSWESISAGTKKRKAGVEIGIGRTVLNEPDGLQLA